MMNPETRDTTRARRRHDLARMKAKARRVYPHDPQATLAEHLHTCSRACCGNPRHHWKTKDALTLQERRFYSDPGW